MNFLKTVALLGLLTGLLILLCYLAIGGIVGAILGVPIAIALNFTMWFHSDKIALSFYPIRPPDTQEKERLDAIVKFLCYRADLDVPKLHIIRSYSPNAFATGRSPKHGTICVTEGLLKMLPDDELEAVIAHELSHIKNWDTLTCTIAATIAGAISIATQLALGSMFGGIFSVRNSGAFRWVALLPMLIFAPLTATLIKLAISRTREYEADIGAARLTGNPRALAKALERLQSRQTHAVLKDATYACLLIVNPLQNQAIGRLFSTHPPTSARIQNLLNISTGGLSIVSLNNRPSRRKRKAIASAILALVAFGLAYAPLPGLQQTVVVVSGTELAEPLKELEIQFENEYPNINLELEFQGSQDIVNNYIDDNNDFTPTVVIPAKVELIGELARRWQAADDRRPFYDKPRAIARTFLVGIAWPERGRVLFPDGQFEWDRLEGAMRAGNWEAIGGQANWGSFDFLMTDPTRSNSGQLTLSLWTRSQLANPTNVNDKNIENLMDLIRRSVYQPPRSTDILLQEFIARCRNDADVATVYESIALHRWHQSADSQEKPYQIYYLNPTVETVATAAIVRRNVSAKTADAARTFLDFLVRPEQQFLFVRYGFRPVRNSIDLTSVPGSPWSQNIPGAEVDPATSLLPAPPSSEIGEIQRLWQRVMP